MFVGLEIYCSPLVVTPPIMSASSSLSDCESLPRWTAPPSTFSCPQPTPTAKFPPTDSDSPTQNRVVFRFPPSILLSLQLYNQLVLLLVVRFSRLGYFVSSVEHPLDSFCSSSDFGASIISSSGFSIRAITFPSPHCQYTTNPSSILHPRGSILANQRLMSPVKMADTTGVKRKRGPGSPDKGNRKGPGIPTKRATPTVATAQDDESAIKAEPNVESAVKAKPNVESVIKTEPDVDVDPVCATSLPSENTSIKCAAEEDSDALVGKTPVDAPVGKSPASPRHTHRDEDIATEKKSSRVDTTEGVDISAVPLEPHGSHSPPPSTSYHDETAPSANDGAAPATLARPSVAPPGPSEPLASAAIVPGHVRPPHERQAAPLSPAGPAAASAPPVRPSAAPACPSAPPAPPAPLPAPPVPPVGLSSRHLRRWHRRQEYNATRAASLGVSAASAPTQAAPPPAAFPAPRAPPHAAPPPAAPPPAVAPAPRAPPRAAPRPAVTPAPRGQPAAVIAGARRPGRPTDRPAAPSPRPARPAGAPARPAPAGREDLRRGTDNQYIDMYKELKRPYVPAGVQRHGPDQMAPEDEGLLCFGVDGIIYRWYTNKGGTRESIGIAVRDGGLSPDVTWATFCIDRIIRPHGVWDPLVDDITRFRTRIRVAKGKPCFPKKQPKPRPPPPVKDPDEGKGFPKQTLAQYYHGL